IGGSAGAIEGLIRVLEKLPADLPATIAVVVHPPAYYESRLVEVLGRRSRLPVAEAADGEPRGPGHVHPAPRDHHLAIDDWHLRLTRDPQQHRFRPAVDPLFVSAAQAYGPRAVGVLLSGGGTDGVRGLIAIKARRGVSIVQDPQEAKNPTMPSSAIADDDVDAILRLDDIPGALVRLTAPAVVQEVEDRAS